MKSDVRKSGKDLTLNEDEFKRRFQKNFYDPWFESCTAEIQKLATVAWKTYSQGRKAPRTQKAGPGFKDPNYDLSVEWIEASEAIKEAMKIHDDVLSPPRVLLISGAHRNDQTCPGEISKTSRLIEMARESMAAEGFETEILDLSLTTSEYGKTIHPCKGCVSTAMPLCHWPCSCYPNHSLGQIHDWMNEIYPMWVRAHGVMIITPVYWHQPPSALKLMMDRLVCADGGNPDPSSTKGKKPEMAKQLELDGWDYPRHLKGRNFSVVVHGDTLGVDDLKGTLCDWLEEMELMPSGNHASIGRYIGYFGPYATSHDSLDKDTDLHQEVRNAALSLMSAVRANRMNLLKGLRPEIQDPRPK